jgi:F-type H+-transporting ATPase subunit gamma
MATLRDIKRRIEAVKNTKQITKAMKMVAAAKLRKAQTKMLEMRPYANKMHSTLTSLAAGAGIESHPLLTPRPRKTIEVIVMTSDRGLCGAYNSNILKTASRFLKDKKEEGFNVSLSVIGKKASDFFKRRDENIRKSWVGLSGNLSYSGVQEIAHRKSGSPSCCPMLPPRNRKRRLSLRQHSYMNLPRKRSITSSFQRILRCRSSGPFLNHRPLKKRPE